MLRAAASSAGMKSSGASPLLLATRTAASAFGSGSGSGASHLALPGVTYAAAARGYCRSSSSLLLQRRLHRGLSHNLAVRALSTGGGGGQQEQQQKKKADGPGGAGGSEEEMSQEIVLTPGEKVVAGTRLAMWAGILCFATACAYYIGKELLPTKMSPNAVFDRATKAVRENPEVQRRFGTPLKAYGRDHGGHREGRRNFIEHTEYTDKDDGSKRTRVRFNLEGQFGHAFVFAEVSSDMRSDEFVYVLVQDKQNGRVITVVDNRSALMAARMAGGSKEGMEAFSNLLGGGKK